LTYAAGGLSTRAVYVMDSGMAAVTGAALDWHAAGCGRFTVLDVATSHTVCAALAGGELAAMVEYHTADLTLERLEALLEDLAAGRLDHRSVLAEGGHGAYVRAAAGPEALETIIATGPPAREGVASAHDLWGTAGGQHADRVRGDARGPPATAWAAPGCHPLKTADRSAFADGRMGVSSSAREATGLSAGRLAAGEPACPLSQSLASPARMV